MDKKTMDIVFRLEMRTRQLILQYKKLQEENRSIRKLLEEKKQEVSLLTQQQNQWKEKYQQLLLAKYVELTDENTKISRGSINKMIRDVEKCIAMLKAKE